ncbi:MAG: ABC transporter permease [Paraburkholderia sp.]|uniref:Putative spermidine/putrescine transport system permease protein n=1 Tax=Paraburkholderia terricola TaxID=169427 RepID=A0A1M6T125_9BURK|nr:MULTISPECIES: ABC transporter permease [Paraburkholderia]TAL95185.1 MAG: ABC transporter permease [Paraburkholderia sp.]SDO71199.1 putative spermidine/putrescine transport system permease protein [Paraburkholderia sediminicola]SHK50617.1 putative spermidine/putrescine transport system permease protein [Paraburkholderia terricola]
MNGSATEVALPIDIKASTANPAQRALRRARVKAFLFVLPLLAFLCIFFVAPIAQMLSRSIDNRSISDVLPRTHRALAEWDRKSLPGEQACRALIADLNQAREQERLGPVARELGYQRSGINRVLFKTARRIGEEAGTSCMDRLSSIDTAWTQLSVWATLKDQTGAVTSAHLLGSFDARLDTEGHIVEQPEDQRIYVELYKRTAIVGLAVTAIVLLMGFPLAHLLANASGRIASVLMMCVLVPFWTSLLVRTTSWIVLLQRDGPLLDLLASLKLIDGQNRPQLAYTMFASLVAISHILLPIMILSLYSVMKGVPKDYVRASLSLGASPLRTFWSVYLPQVAPGIATGSVLVFITTLGVYITPALVGGSSGQMIGNMIAYHMQSSLNWGLAAGLSAVLLVAVWLVFYVFNRVVGLEKMGVAK